MKLEDYNYNIFLTHSPKIISDLKTIEENKGFIQKLDLILCGHMHGGYIPKLIRKLGFFGYDKGFESLKVMKIKKQK